MSDILTELAKKGCKILTDTKTPKETNVKAKEIPYKEPEQVLTANQALVKKFIKEKPHKKHLIDFFEKVIEAEEKLL